MPKKRILQDRGVVRVTFELPAEVEGRTVHLVGDFTSWKGVPMEKRKEGGWQATVDLEPGRSYEFRYMIDGTRWENDWAADRYVHNPFGHENSVVDTPALSSESSARLAADGAAAGPAAKRTAPAAKAPSAKAPSKATAATSPAKKAAPAGPAATAKKAATKKAATKKAAMKKAPAKTAPRKGAPGSGSPRKSGGDTEA